MNETHLKLISIFCVKCFKAIGIPAKKVDKTLTLRILFKLV